MRDIVREPPSSSVHLAFTGLSSTLVSDHLLLQGNEHVLDALGGSVP